MEHQHQFRIHHHQDRLEARYKTLASNSRTRAYYPNLDLLPVEYGDIVRAEEVVFHLILAQ
jgi:hypothetical protein